MTKEKKSIKFISIWILVTFIFTSIALIFVNKIEFINSIGDTIKYIVNVMVFVIIGLVIYTPIEKIVGEK